MLKVLQSVANMVPMTFKQKVPEIINCHFLLIQPINKAVTADYLHNLYYLRLKSNYLLIHITVLSYST